MTERKTRRRGTLRTAGRQLEEAAAELMRGWRTQAKRHDRVGEVSHRGLEVLHDGLDLTARVLTRMASATQPPPRTTRPEPHPPAPAHPTRHTPAAPRASRPARPRREPHAGAS